jgi:auxin influx carrier (AUX1 LAX family)
MAILMNIHQYIAFALYGTSLAYIWEKLWRVHTKPWYIRVPIRLPLAGFIWFLAILCPFYGPINSLYASLAIPFLGFVVPSMCMLTFFKSREQLDNSILKPYKFIRRDFLGIAPMLEKIHPRLGLMSTLWFWMNFFCIVIFSGFGVAAIYYSSLFVAQSYRTFGAFNNCYGCIG